MIGCCEGAIAGLVGKKYEPCSTMIWANDLKGITPAAGFVSIWSAGAIGLITAGTVCCFQNVNRWLHIDDGLEVFKLHGIGGMVGGFLTGIFATSKISALDGESIYSGAIDGNGIQVAKQLAEICAIAAYSFTVSLCLLMILKYIPGMHLRVADEAEIMGYDMDQFHEETIGEWALWETQQHGHIEGVNQGGRESISEDRSTVPHTKAKEILEEKAVDDIDASQA